MLRETGITYTYNYKKLFSNNNSHGNNHNHLQLLGLYFSNTTVTQQILPSSAFLKYYLLQAIVSEVLNFNLG